MKTFLLLISFGILTLTIGIKDAKSSNYSRTSSIQNNLTEQKATKKVLTFDGYEGGYYFFTDSDNLAVQFEQKDVKNLGDFDFENNDFVDSTFVIEEDLILLNVSEETYAQ